MYQQPKYARSYFFVRAGVPFHGAFSLWVSLIAIYSIINDS